MNHGNGQHREGFRPRGWLPDVHVDLEPKPWNHVLARLAQRNTVEEQVRAATAATLAVADEVVTDMILRHLYHSCDRADNLHLAELAHVLAVIIGRNDAEALVLRVIRILEAGWESGSSGAASADEDMTHVPWPAATYGHPPDHTTALDPLGPYGAARRGVAVRPCVEATKGMGVFAVRPLASGDLIGVYWGEQLTLRECWARHGPGQRLHSYRGRGSIDALVAKAKQAERRERLDQLTSSKPSGGADNGGAYLFTLPESASAGREPSVLGAGGEEILYIDAEASVCPTTLSLRPCISSHLRPELVEWREHRRVRRTPLVRRFAVTSITRIGVRPLATQSTTLTAVWRWCGSRRANQFLWAPRSVSTTDRHMTGTAISRSRERESLVLVRLCSLGL